MRGLGGEGSMEGSRLGQAITGGAGNNIAIHSARLWWVLLSPVNPCYCLQGQLLKFYQKLAFLKKLYYLCHDNQSINPHGRLLRGKLLRLIGGLVLRDAFPRRNDYFTFLKGHAIPYSCELIGTITRRCVRWKSGSPIAGCR